MAEASGSKRPFLDDDDDDDDTKQEKKVRFPKGKKARNGGQRSAGGEDGAWGSWMDPHSAKSERAKRRNRDREREVFGGGRDDQDVGQPEVNYADNASFDDDGIQIEPFNLNQEREEGYFDEAGNFVEYMNKEIKDAWLDGVDTELKFAEQIDNKIFKEEEDYQDLSSADIGKIKRNIASTLQPGETVIQALKRLKGTTSDKKVRMPEDTKQLFDQLTEDAMKLMENGEYNVYHEKRETFDREAEGYERVACAIGGTSNGSQELPKGEDVFSESSRVGMSVVDVAVNPSKAEFDMFGDEDDPNPVPSSNIYSEKLDVGFETDYVFDDLTGYYYSSSSGYYYDPGSGLYCFATTGKWYSYNEQSGVYDEVQDTAPVAVAE